MHVKDIVMRPTLTTHLDEVPPDIASSETFTEIVVTELHSTASRAVSGRRLAEYLAAKVAASPDLEAMSRPSLGVFCFRIVPPAAPEAFA